MKIETVGVRVLRVTPETAYEAARITIDAFWHVLTEVTTSDGVPLIPADAELPDQLPGSRHLSLHHSRELPGRAAYDHRSVT